MKNVENTPTNIVLVEYLNTNPIISKLKFSASKLEMYIVA